MGLTCKKAVVLLHEIYGVNDHIKGCMKYLESMGYEVFCPNILDREAFSYAEEKKAYNYYYAYAEKKGYEKVLELLEKLRGDYDEIVIIGYSAGATLAWRFCELDWISGIVCCYGSRIRDYTYLTPKIPALLQFAKRESFDVESVVERLREKEMVQVEVFDALHGFMNPYIEAYDAGKATSAEQALLEFLKVA